LSGEETQDAELLVATAKGDENAFALLVRRYIRGATLLGTQITGDQDEAEDIAQIAFAIVYQRAATFDVTRPFAPWLFGIVRRIAFNRRAKDLRRARLLEVWSKLTGRTGNDSAGSVDASASARIDMDVITGRLTTLSPMQRACFELVALRGVAIAEAAAMHGIAESTVRQHVFRARRLLKEGLDGGTIDDNKVVSGSETP
jgi:RNA polymerase sigma-70 factor (ECF subfamily)